MTLRNERLSDRVLFIQFRRWDHLVSNEEKNAMTRRIKTIVNDKKESPIDYVAGLSSYIFTDQYKQRLNEHSETVQGLLECKTRTSRNYAFGLVFVDLIFDEFEEELKAVKLSREGFYHYLKTDFLPSIKPFHEEAEDHIKVCCWLGKVLFHYFIFSFYCKVITRWLRAILKMTEDWEVSDCLNYFRLVESKKTNPPGRCLALANDPTKMSPDDPMTLGDFGTLVSQYGGLKSYNTMLKQVRYYYSYNHYSNI